MTKAELEERLKEQQKIIDRRKRKIKEQNENAKEKWDMVSCRLPKGTKTRIEGYNLSVNGLINRLVLAELDRLDSLKNNSENFY